MLSVALTTFERYEMTVEAIQKVLHDDRISEFVIVDDASTDDSYERLQDEYKNHDHVKLFRNQQNVDCNKNKAVAVNRCSSPWVILLDSDNILGPEYLDAIQGEWNPYTAYLPTFARPEFDYRAFAGHTVVRSNLADYLDEPMFLTALNTANYLFARDEYLKVWDPDTDPHTADSIYQNYRWLDAGNALYFVPGMEYDHRMHSGSHFVQNHTRELEDYKRSIEAKLRELAHAFA